MKDENPNLQNIYLDTCLLIGCLEWLIKKKYHYKFSYFDKLIKREREQPFIMVFFNEHQEIDKWISIVSVAEIYKILKYDNKFKKYNINSEQIEKLLGVLQNIMGFKIIIEFEIDSKNIKGNLITGEIIKYIDKCPDIMDCIHIDIAKSTELMFLTMENKLGVLKELYEPIMSENKYFKQFK